MTDERASVVSVKDHLEARIDSLEKQMTLSINSLKDNVAVARDASDKAITKAELAAERRFEGVNEFRATLSDQAGTFLPRSEYSVQHTSLSTRIEKIDKDLTTLSGKSAGGKDVWAYMLSVGAVLISAATLVVLMVSRFH